MNWNKIINIFIIIFCVINLGIFAYRQYHEHELYTLSDERVDLLRSILNKNGYALYDHVPDFYPMSKIVLESPQVDKQAVVGEIFGDTFYNYSFTTDSEKYTNDEQQLIFYKGSKKGIITYQGYNSLFVTGAFNRETVEEIGAKFAKAITLSIPRLELTYLKEYNDYYLIEFNEVFKGKTLFCSYVSMKISADGRIEAKALRFEPKDFAGKEKAITPIDEVLYNFVRIIKPSPKELYSIKKLDLGYHLAVDTLEENVSVEAVPYYRIKLDDDSEYYVNAYTNELRFTILE